ncbi:MAG: acetolactate synthase [Blastochloris sp.]|nr:acetolactate synthase [Blastochloris sp.]
MPAETMRSEKSEPVKQFSVFTENKVGRLHEIIRLLNERSIHAVALTILDTTDSSIHRMIVDDPDEARQLLLEHGITFSETNMLVVELEATTDLIKVLSALLETEINIHYCYPFIYRPHERSALALHLEDPELAAQSLGRYGFKILGQRDISR